MGFLRGVETMGCALGSEPTAEGVFSRLDDNGDGKIDKKDMKKLMGKNFQADRFGEKFGVSESSWCSFIRNSIESKCKLSYVRAHNGDPVGLYDHIDEQIAILCRQFHASLDDGKVSDELLNHILRA